MDKTLIENNRMIIAEFDGWNFLPNGNCWHERFNDHGQQIEMIPSILSQYHTSWDWLIPVVEKIELLGYVVIIQQRSCYIQSHDTRSVLSTAQLFDSKIQTVWTAVISFIQWYNSQSKTNNNEK